MCDSSATFTALRAGFGARRLFEDDLVEYARFGGDTALAVVGDGATVFSFR